MSNYIDWGNCSPNKAELRKKQEADAILEQAARMRAAKQTILGIGGGSKPSSIFGIGEGQKSTLRLYYCNQSAGYYSTVSGGCGNSASGD